MAWTANERAEIARLINSYQPGISPEVLQQLLNLLKDKPFQESRAALNDLILNGPTKPLSFAEFRELLKQGKAQVGGKLEMYKLIEGYDKQVYGQPTIEYRGMRWEVSPGALSRKLDWNGTWEASNSRAIPFGDLPLEALALCVEAYRRMPKRSNKPEPPPGVGESLSQEFKDAKRRLTDKLGKEGD